MGCSVSKDTGVREVIVPVKKETTTTVEKTAEKSQETSVFLKDDSTNISPNNLPTTSVRLPPSVTLTCAAHKPSETTLITQKSSYLLHQQACTLDAQEICSGFIESCTSAITQLQEALDRAASELGIDLQVVSGPQEVSSCIVGASCASPYTQLQEALERAASELDSEQQDVQEDSSCIDSCASPYTQLREALERASSELDSEQQAQEYSRSIDSCASQLSRSALESAAFELDSELQEAQEYSRSINSCASQLSRVALESAAFELDSELKEAQECSRFIDSCASQLSQIASESGDSELSRQLQEALEYPRFIDSCASQLSQVALESAASEELDSELQEEAQGYSSSVEELPSEDDWESETSETEYEELEEAQEYSSSVEELPSEVSQDDWESEPSETEYEQREYPSSVDEDLACDVSQDSWESETSETEYEQPDAQEYSSSVEELPSEASQDDWESETSEIEFERREEAQEYSSSVDEELPSEFSQDDWESETSDQTEHEQRDESPYRTALELVASQLVLDALSFAEYEVKQELLQAKNAEACAASKKSDTVSEELLVKGTAMVIKKIPQSEIPANVQKGLPSSNVPRAKNMAPVFKATSYRPVMEAPPRQNRASILRASMPKSTGERKEVLLPGKRVQIKTTHKIDCSAPKQFKVPESRPEVNIKRTGKAGSDEASAATRNRPGFSIKAIQRNGSPPKHPKVSQTSKNKPPVNIKTTPNSSVGNASETNTKSRPTNTKQNDSKQSKVPQTSKNIPRLNKDRAKISGANKSSGPSILSKAVTMNGKASGNITKSTSTVRRTKHTINVNNSKVTDSSKPSKVTVTKPLAKPKVLSTSAAANGNVPKRTNDTVNSKLDKNSIRRPVAQKMLTFNTKAATARKPKVDKDTSTSNVVDASKTDNQSTKSLITHPVVFEDAVETAESPIRDELLYTPDISCPCNGCINGLVSTGKSASMSSDLLLSLQMSDQAQKCGEGSIVTADNDSSEEEPKVTAQAASNVMDEASSYIAHSEEELQVTAHAVLNVEDEASSSLASSSEETKVAGQAVSNAQDEASSYIVSSRREPKVTAQAVSNVKDEASSYITCSEEPKVTAQAISNVKDEASSYITLSGEEPKVAAQAVSNIKDEASSCIACSEEEPKIAAQVVSNVKDEASSYIAASEEEPKVAAQSISNVKYEASSYIACSEEEPKVAAQTVSNVKDEASSYIAASEEEPKVIAQAVSNVKDEVSSEDESRSYSASPVLVHHPTPPTARNQSKHSSSVGNSSLSLDCNKANAKCSLTSGLRRLATSNPRTLRRTISPLGIRKPPRSALEQRLDYAKYLESDVSISGFYETTECLSSSPSTNLKRPVTSNSMKLTKTVSPSRNRKISNSSLEYRSKLDYSRYDSDLSISGKQRKFGRDFRKTPCLLELPSPDTDSLGSSSRFSSRNSKDSGKMVNEKPNSLLPHPPTSSSGKLSTASLSSPKVTNNRRRLVPSSSTASPNKRSSCSSRSSPGTATKRTCPLAPRLPAVPKTGDLPIGDSELRNRRCSTAISKKPATTYLPSPPTTPPPSNAFGRRPMRRMRKSCISR